MRSVLSARSDSDSAPLSYAQEAMWFLHELEGRGHGYTLTTAARLRGPLDEAALRDALQTIGDRHEILRTRFVVRGGGPVQLVDHSSSVRLEVEDLQEHDAAAQRRAVSDAMDRERCQPFELADGPAWRVRLLRLGPQDHVLVRAAHHIVWDAWSQDIFNRELSELYEAYRRGAANPLPPLAIQYADYAVWERSWLTEDVLRERVQYWTRQLNGIPEHLDLPLDRPRPATQTSEASMCARVLPASTTALLAEISRAHRTTLYVTLLAGLAAMLARTTDRGDIVLGSPVVNRGDTKLESLIGLFVNQIAIRVTVAAGATLAALIGLTRQTIIDALRHADVPFARVVRSVAAHRSLTRAPVCQGVFTWRAGPAEPPSLAGLQTETVIAEKTDVRADFELHAYHQGSHVHMFWLYSRALFASERIQRLADEYVRLLGEMASAPSDRIDRLA